MNRNELNWRA